MSREEIFSRIRAGLKRGEPDAKTREVALARIAARSPNLIPARAQGSESEQIALFLEMARAASAEIIELSDLAQLPEQVAQRLQRDQITELVRSTQDDLDALDWNNCTGVSVRTGIAKAGDRASLTGCFAGIAETGTLMLHSQAQSPTSLNFLPDLHLVLLRSSQIVGVYEEAWSRLRAARGDNWPRTVNMITGPSRSADIGQVLQMGAHGPCELSIFLLDDRATDNTH